jgi:hypothetical protein
MMQGYLTYTLVALAILGAGAGYVFGTIDGPTAIATIWAGLFACANCNHAGEDHEHRASRTRGFCKVCPCRRYRPNVNRKPPVNQTIDRYFRA